MRYNLEQNICRLFHFLAQFLVTTSETELDYYTTEWKYELPHELPKDLSKLGNLRKLGTLRKLENFRKILGMLGFDGEHPAVHPIAKFWHSPLKSRQKSAVKQSFVSNLLTVIIWGNRFLFLARSRFLMLHFLLIYYLKSRICSSNWYLGQLSCKKIWIWYLSKNTILQFSVKYEFGTQRCSSCNRAVFMKRFYFFLLKTDNF